MRSRDAKIKFFNRARQWALATGIAFMLVASPQVWAGIMFVCEPQLGREHSCCLTGRHSDAAVEMQGEHSTSDTSTFCETSTLVTHAVKVSIQPTPLTVCCVLQPQNEPLARFVQSESQTTAVSVQFADSLFRSTMPGSSHIFNPISRGSKRPLYLAFSCFLI